jgi:methionyl-tRNA synthetase
MIGKYSGSRLIRHADFESAATIGSRETQVDPAVVAKTAIESVVEAFGNAKVHTALYFAEVIMINANGYVDSAAPWKLAKNLEEAAKLGAVLYSLAESLRIIAILISPVLPKAAHGIFDQLNWKMELSGKEERFSLADAEWGKLPDGHVVGKPVPLFPRIETSEL